MIDGNYAVRVSLHILHSLVQIPLLLTPKNGDGGALDQQFSDQWATVLILEVYLSIH